MSAPTETEIRAALTKSIGGGYVDLDNNGRWLAPITDSDMALVRAGWQDGFNPPEDHPGTFWADLRPSEATELQEAMFAALHRVELEATAMLIEATVAAAVAFAKAHPDIPRGHWPNGWKDPDEARARKATA